MKLVELLNKLEREGVLSPLYQAGAVTLVVYNQREIFNTYHALLASPRYADKVSEAVRVTAQRCRVARSTVYTALRVMRQEV